jgi:hypothetical protein
MKCHPPSSYSADAASRSRSRVEASHPTADPDIASLSEEAKWMEAPQEHYAPARAQPGVADFFRRVHKWPHCLCASKLCLHKRALKTLSSAALLAELLEVLFLTFVLL